ncbi:hypothetical protein GTN31_01355 [Macrococcoides canis]|uniref:Uncharacterized protein n=1 Tax=Macrococcoides canis TaxID=1855823 RepID=A0A6G7ENQ4_9STAP|nr:hypothetical protein [Macrococcus canis]QHW12358.1 hypothetical protein SD607_00004 [Macrococcus canis]QIH74992.1 hypothetical protein GTN31_01355 [Macrococcus canis]
MEHLEIPNGFNNNEFSFSNNKILKLYDSLAVIDRSLNLIINEGLHEFEPVIMQQLRLILTESNDTHDPKKNPNNKDFALIDLLRNYQLIKESTNKPIDFESAKLFPKISIQNRPYRERVENSPYFFISEESFHEYNALTLDEFLNWPLLEVEDSKGNTSMKTVKQCIKILANKAQGAHYQVYIRKVELDVIVSLNDISQLLGLAIIRSIMPLTKKIIQLNNMENYFDRTKFVSYNIFSYSPL